MKSCGVSRAAVFGSVARGEAGPDSDLDILIEIPPGSKMDVFRYIGIVEMIQSLFPMHVDVSNRSQLKAHVRPHAERDAVYAF